MSSPLCPAMVVPLEDSGDSEEWQIFEITNFYFELTETLPKPEASDMESVEPMEDHPWTYSTSPEGSPEVIVIKVSDSDCESNLDETPSIPQASKLNGAMDWDESLPYPEIVKTEGVWEMEDHPQAYTLASVGSQQNVVMIKVSATIDETPIKPETFDVQGVWHIEENQTANVPAMAGSQQDHAGMKVSDRDGESQLNGTLPKTETFDYEWQLKKASKLEGIQETLMNIMREFHLDAYRTIQCLFFNSGEVGSTMHFLRTGLRPDGYPIWEPKDDADLKKNIPKLRAQLIAKYGEENVAKRLAFLES
ncbi:uncharacterized protein ACMZJ9_011449 isoform 1-T2 [Mantella aurantiaca]